MEQTISVLQANQYVDPKTKEHGVWRVSGVVFRVRVEQDEKGTNVYPVVDFIALNDDETGVRIYEESYTESELQAAIEESLALHDVRPVTAVRLPRNYFWKPDKVLVHKPKK